MILVLIAGSATPLFLISVGGSLGLGLLLSFWGLAACALAVHLLWTAVPEAVVASTYIALGCLGGAALPGVWMHAGITAFTLVVGGGLTYIGGAVLYHHRRPDPRPEVFGFHEVFHCCVCLAATVQYVAIAVFVL
jgi:hemolysin III